MPISSQIGLTWVAERWQTWKDFAHRQSHSGLLGHTHHHDEFKRHHHAAGDASVMALGVDEATSAAAAEVGAAAAAGSATLPMAMAMPWLLPPSVASMRLWCATAAAGWRNAEVRRLDRPPMA